MAGYSGTPLVKKLGLKSGMTMSFVAAPEHYDNLLGELPSDAKVKNRGTVDFIHLFVTSEVELRKQFPILKKRLESSGLMWISWPKGTSKIKTDLNGNLVREIGLGNGLVDVKVCAVDDDWSGLKFVFRLADR